MWATSKTLCEAYFVAARSDENAFKITTGGKNENTDQSECSAYSPVWELKAEMEWLL